MTQSNQVWAALVNLATLFLPLSSLGGAGPGPGTVLELSAEMRNYYFYFQVLFCNEINSVKVHYICCF